MGRATLAAEMEHVECMKFSDGEIHVYAPENFSETFERRDWFQKIESAAEEVFGGEWRVPPWCYFDRKAVDNELDNRALFKQKFRSFIWSIESDLFRKSKILLTCAVTALDLTELDYVCLSQIQERSGLTRRMVQKECSKLDDIGSIDHECITIESTGSGYSITGKGQEVQIKKRLLEGDYNKYLNSDTWKAKAKRIKRKFDFKCALCSSGQNLHTHHRTYQNLGFEKDDDLIALCSDCHSEFHHRTTLDEVVS
jgi:hypothetical protein